eukprot:COSAG02_NODE_954_length_15689_cov_14.145927_14_plen_91_part_00
MASASKTKRISTSRLVAARTTWPRSLVHVARVCAGPPGKVDPPQAGFATEQPLKRSARGAGVRVGVARIITLIQYKCLSAIIIVNSETFH